MIPAPVHDKDGVLWYERTFSTWLKAKNEAVAIELASPLTYENHVLQMMRVGYRLKPDTKISIEAASAHSDYFTTEDVAVVATCRVWLTHVQALEWHIRELEAEIKQLEDDKESAYLNGLEQGEMWGDDQ